MTIFVKPSILGVCDSPQYVLKLLEKIREFTVILEAFFCVVEFFLQQRCRLWLWVYDTTIKTSTTDIFLWIF